MNDNDLERRLRSEIGPRERGYLPAQLPAVIEAAPANRRPSRAIRIVFVVSAVMAGAMAVAAAGALLSDGTPGGVGSDATATPLASATQTEPADCKPVDVVLSAEPWGGAAGSRGTVVSVTLAEGRYPCRIERNVHVGIFDAEGSVLVSTEEEGARDPILLDQADVLALSVSWSNWCGPDVARPIQLVLYSTGSTFPVEVPAGTDPLPPCMGEGQPTLSVTGLQPAD